MNTQSLILSMSLLSTLVILSYYALNGHIVALIAVTIMIAGVLIAFGSLVTLYVVKVMQSNSQNEFVSNAKENLDIIGKVSAIQNQQNTSLLRQIPENGYAPIFEANSINYDEL